MAHPSRPSMRTLLGASALALSVISGPVLADTVFTKPLVDFAGRVSAGGGPGGPPLLPSNQTI